MNHFQEIPLGQLRVIRGNSLYERQFALSVFLNYPKDGSSGLNQLGLMNLTGIEGGGVCLVHHLVPFAPVNYEILNKKSFILFQHKSLFRNSRWRSANNQQQVPEIWPLGLLAGYHQEQRCSH